MITISEYINLFMTIMLGLGLVFEMPILVFFLALFGLVTPGWMLRNFRYSVLGIFIIAGIITPTPDIMSMCIFAAPMLILYLISIGVAYMVHPNQRKKRELNSQ
jgi:sec-independent protein translocase protein TatC